MRLAHTSVGWRGPWWGRSDPGPGIEPEAVDGKVCIVFFAELWRWRVVGDGRAFRDEGEVVGRKSSMLVVLYR